MCLFRHGQKGHQMSAISTKVIRKQFPDTTSEKDENFKYLGRYYNFQMEESKHRDKAKTKIEDLMTSIDALPLHPKKKCNYTNITSLARCRGISL